jgi:hypothetical protein
MAHVAARNECHATSGAFGSVGDGFTKIDDVQVLPQTQGQYHDRRAPTSLGHKQRRHDCAMVELAFANRFRTQLSRSGQPGNLSRKLAIILKLHASFARRKASNVPNSRSLVQTPKICRWREECGETRTMVSALLATKRRAASRMALIVESILPARVPERDGVRIGACGIRAAYTTEPEVGFTAVRRARFPLSA